MSSRAEGDPRDKLISCDFLGCAKLQQPVLKEDRR